MSIISGFCSLFISLFGVADLLSLPTNGQISANNPVVISNVRTIYNNSPRNLEECNFTEFLERFDLTDGLDEVVIYKNDDTQEIIPV